MGVFSHGRECNSIPHSCTRRARRAVVGSSDVGDAISNLCRDARRDLVCEF